MKRNRDARPRWAKLYDQHFPHDTDAASRHVKTIAQSLRRRSSALRKALTPDISGWEPDHMAASMEMTVVALWRARAEIRRLKARLAGHKPVIRTRK